jgi:hypothetical protein
MAILPVRFCVLFAALLVRYPSTTLLYSTCAHSVLSWSTRTNMASSDEQQQQQEVPRKKSPLCSTFSCGATWRIDRQVPWVMAAKAANVSVAAITQGIAVKDDDALEHVAPENLPHMTKYYVYGVN